MIEIDNIPIIELQVNWLKEFGMKDVIVLVGHLKEKIKHHLADGTKFGVNIRYIDENVPLGTGGALNNAKNQILENGKTDTGFFVINGDIVPVGIIMAFVCNKCDKNITTFGLLFQCVAEYFIT